MRTDNLLILLSIVAVLFVIAGIVFLEVHCWNVPIAFRAGWCSLLH